MEDCARMGIEVVNPDVNQSHVDFAVTGGKIVFALSAIKGCGGGAAEAIVAARKERWPVTSLSISANVSMFKRCGRSAIESLIKAGAMDSFGAERAG